MFFFSILLTNNLFDGRILCSNQRNGIMLSIINFWLLIVILSNYVALVDIGQLIYQLNVFLEIKV